MNSYDLSRKFIDYSFENPSKIKPNHYALYFFSIEHCNRLGWKKEFGLPTTMAMEAIGIKSYNTYSKTFYDLESFGFFNIIEVSKNQYSSNIIALSNFDKALDKALDKAFVKHGSKHCSSTVESIDSIIKQITNKQINKKQVKKLNIFINNFLKDEKTIYPTLKEFLTYCVESIATDRSEYLDKRQSATLKYKSWQVDDWHKTINGKRTKIKNWKSTILNTWKYL